MESYTLSRVFDGCTLMILGETKPKAQRDGVCINLNATLNTTQTTLLFFFHALPDASCVAFYILLAIFQHLPKTLISRI